MIRFQSPVLPSVDRVAQYFAASESARRFANSGPCHEQLVDRLQQWFAPRDLHCVPLSSGTDALLLGIAALVDRTHEGRDKVLLPSFTFAAVANAVVWAGLRPVFVDVHPKTWHLDATALAAALEELGDRVALVLAASTFGFPPPPEQRRAWESLCRDAGVPLLVDSAAGFGAVARDGVPLGGQGDAEIFSFHATKPFAIGEGGLLVTGDADVASRVRRLSNFGFVDQLVGPEVGLNAKLAEWPAATALAVLDRFEEVLATRRGSARAMVIRLAEVGYGVQSDVGDGAWQFVPAVAPSDEIRDRALALAVERNVELRTYYTPLHTMPAFATAARGDLTVTERLGRRMLSLPMANDLTPEDAERVVVTLELASSDRRLTA
jgi:dTDP-4-amino-4,6-dideoxygalactose transaminase